MPNIAQRIHHLHLHDLHFTVPGSHISAKAVVLAGLVSGAVFLGLELIMLPVLMGASPWALLRMIAAITQGTSVLTPIDTFDLSAALAAGCIHFALSLAYALLFAFIGKGRSIAADASVGAAFGLVLYLVNFHLFAAWFPWFIEMRGWTTLAGHLVYGVALGATYAAFAAGRIGRHPTATT